jgi:aminoglycoside phosphotransferase (APT) family kinase protein
MIPDLESLLQRYCSSKLRNKFGVRVRGISDSKSGVESDIYFFLIEHGLAQERQTEELVLRIYTRVDAYDKSQHEFIAMRRLREAGYPVPLVLAVERDNSPFKQPFMIMERIVGQEMWQLLNDSSQQRQKEVLTHLSRLLVQLHSLECKPFVNEQNQYKRAGRSVFVDRWLESLRPVLVRFPIVGLEPVFEWLVSRREAVPCLKPSLVHSDFHPGNVLVRDDGSAVVLDWTGLDISDARFDLAHTLLLLSCIANSEWRDIVLGAYEEFSDAPVEQLAYFDVAACFRWFLALTVSMRYGPDKVGLGPQAVTRLRPSKSALKKAHELLHTRTNLTVPEIEAMISELPQQVQSREDAS